MIMIARLLIPAVALLAIASFGFSQETKEEKKEETKPIAEAAKLTNQVTAIPFRLTESNNIVIQGTLNKTDAVDLMFHTATSDLFLTKEAAKRTTSVQFDKEAKINSWGGSSSVRFSESNTLQIGKLRWDKIPITEAINSGQSTDGKCGPDLFEG